MLIIFHLKWFNGYIMYSDPKSEDIYREIEKESQR